MTFPTQPDEISENRQAVAPYNFVPLPEKIVSLNVADLPDQGKYHADRVSGHIECVLTTESPLYVRAGVTPEQVKSGKQAKDIPAFFYLNDEGNPVIPGSSLRGLLRSLVEIVTYSKVSFVADKKMVYRSVGGATNHDAHYRDMMMRPDGERDGKKYYTPLIMGGYMEKTAGGDWAIRPAKQIGGTTYAHIRIDERLFRSLKPIDHTRNAFEIFIRTSPYDYQDVRGGFLKIKYARVLEAKADPGPGLWRGSLAKSGWMSSKRTEAVIYEADSSADLLDINEELIDVYKEQVSKEQEKLLGKDGVLIKGQPVFYIVDKIGKVVFFGHARMFRVPYPKTAHDHIPVDIRDSKSPDLIDWTEAIFGYTKESGEGRQRSYAGRVFIQDARLLPAQKDIWLVKEKTVTPKILSGPKPTTFQHYLVQSEPENYPIGKTRDGKTKFETRLRDYESSSPKDTVIRGTKFYWHKGAVEADDIIGQTSTNSDAGKADTQHTEINPLRKDVNFKFKINFDNLSKKELGAILFVLEVLASGETTRLKLGMGKPLGMGAIKIKPTLFSFDPIQRFETLVSGEKWEQGLNKNELVSQEALRLFLEAMKEELGIELLKAKRIKELIRLLQWPGPSVSLTRYMEIKRTQEDAIGGGPNEYKSRPVLPTPFGVWVKQKKLDEQKPPAKTDLQPDELRGVVVSFGLGPNQSFGYIQPSDSVTQIFVHKNNLQGLKILKSGQKVIYKKGTAMDGREQAVDVRLDRD